MPGVSGSERGDEASADLSAERVSETEDAVEVEEGVIGYARGCGCSVRVGVTKGRKDCDRPLWSALRPRPIGLGAIL